MKERGASASRVRAPAYPLRGNLCHFVDKGQPFGPARRHCVWPVPGDVAGPAQRHGSRDVVGVRAFAQGWIMVRFQACRPPTLGAPPAVTGEGSAAGRFPPAGVQTGVVPAHCGELRRPWRDRLLSGAVRVLVNGENQASWEVRPELPYARCNLIELFFCDCEVLVRRGAQEGQFRKISIAFLQVLRTVFGDYVGKCRNRFDRQ